MKSKVYKISVIVKFFIIFLSALFPAFALAASTEKVFKTSFANFLVQGSSNFSGAVRNQSFIYEQKQFEDGKNNRQNKDLALENNSQLYLKLENKKSAIKEDKFGLSFKFESEVSSAQNKGTLNLDQGFIYLDSKTFGKFEIGDNIPVNQKMKVGPASFARGNGGINGNYLKYINLPVNSQFILIAQSPLGHSNQALGGSQLNQDSIKILRSNSFNGAEDATKLNYYSPRISGLQIGVTYTPNTSDSIISSTVFNGKNNAAINVISLAANYTNSFNNFDYAFFATSESGKSKSATQNNLSAFDFGATMAYFGFTFGASYGSWNKSLQATNQNFKSATYKTYGLAYQLGHISISVTNLNSSFEKNTYQANSLGLDYKLNKDFIPYFEITKFRFKTNQQTNSESSDNRGFVALGGFLILF
ncbi:MAG: porin [Rickettsiales bacterium]|nr:porin [Rickettsiales bacterium]